MYFRQTKCDDDMLSCVPHEDYLQLRLAAPEAMSLGLSFLPSIFVHLFDFDLVLVDSAVAGFCLFCANQETGLDQCLEVILCRTDFHNHVSNMTHCLLI